LEKKTNDLLFIKLAGAVGHSAESNIGTGGKAGEIPNDLEQATGLEREELLAKLQGKELFDMEPLNMTHIGTPKNPIVVQSHDPIRFVGCTGKL
jgi:cytochrome c oxidase subunit 5b